MSNSRIMFTKKDFVLQEFRNLKKKYRLSFSKEEEAKIIDIINTYDWNLFRKGLRKRLWDLICSVQTKDKVPWMIKYLDEVKCIYLIMYNEDQKDEITQNCINRIKETDWETVDWDKYRDTLENIVYECVEEFLNNGPFKNHFKE